MAFLKPYAIVIAHTAFDGVPTGLLPLDAARKIQCERLAASQKRTAEFNAKGEEERKGQFMLEEPEEHFLSDFAIEGLARELVAAKGQLASTEAENLIETAGRACYDSFGNGRDSKSYHEHIMDVDHGSVTEHANLTFFLGNISRGLTHELVRHRVGVAISQRSTRYVDESLSEWAEHPLCAAYIADLDSRILAGDQDAIVARQVWKNNVDYAMDISRRAYQHVVSVLEPWAIERAGCDKFTARKQARGAARGYLGNALSTEMVWSANCRTIRTVILKQRAAAAADAEIRLEANALYEAALPYWPTYLSRFQKRATPDGIGYELYLPDQKDVTISKLMVEVAGLKMELAKFADPQIGTVGNGG